MDVQWLTGYIGGDVAGVDLRAPLSPDLVESLRRALARYGVLVFRGQHPTLAQQKALTAVFGSLMTLPYVKPIPDDETVIAVLKEAHEHSGGVFGGEWHSDFSFLENPPAGSVLSAVEIPAVGGDTLWASQVAAYRTLPGYMKDIVDRHDAIHVGKPYGVKFAPPPEERANASIVMSRGDPDADREIMHPSVVTDPISGDKALFLNPIYTTRFDGLTEAQSAPLLDQIYRHATRPDFSYRHRWCPGDLVVWDNRTTLHYTTNDYAGSRRLLYRTAFRRARPAR